MKLALKVLVQLALILGLSYLALDLLGSEIYMTVGLAIGLLSLGVILAASHDEHAPFWAWLLTPFIVSTLFGLLWPVLPLSFALSNIRGPEPTTATDEAATDESRAA